MEEKDIMEFADEEIDNGGSEETEENLDVEADADAEEDMEEAEDDDTFDVIDEEDDSEEADEDNSDDSEEPEESEEPESPTEQETGQTDELSAAVDQLFASVGVKNVEDRVKAVKELTAQALGITLQELEIREANAKAEQEAWNKQSQSDIEAIHKAFPVTKKYKSLHDLPNKMEFARLMDEGKLSVVAAFAETHPDIANAQPRKGGNHSDLKDTKAHMTSSVPKGAKDMSANISKREMESFREMYPELSDAEIKKLYKTVTR